jgi:hypothetical protein
MRDDTQGLRFDNGRNGNKDRRQADHAMHEGDQLRHFGHLYTFGHDRAHGATHQQADQYVTHAGSCQFGAQLIDQPDGGHHGQRHAEHAEQVATAGGGRVRKALERLDEADRGDQVKKGDKIHAHY